MHTINYESKKLVATITCKDDTISDEVFESMAKSLLKHATAHLGTYSIPELFNKIINLRTDYLTKVLVEMADEFQGMGGEIPQEIATQIIGERKIELEDEEEEKPPWE